MQLNLTYWFYNENAYLNFINECRTKPIQEETEYHIHHIVPKHWIRNIPDERQFCESPENLIQLSLNDHIQAHQLLYDLYKKPMDKAAVLMLSGDKAASRRIWRQLGAEKVHTLLRSQQTNFWNSDFQKEMARRSIEKPDAL